MAPTAPATRLTIRAHPGARQERVEALADGTVGVWVREKAVEGRANAAIEQAVAAALGLKPRQVSVVGGATSRVKALAVELESQDEARRRLLARAVRAPRRGVG